MRTPTCEIAQKLLVGCMAQGVVVSGHGVQSHGREPRPDRDIGSGGMQADMVSEGVSRSRSGHFDAS